MARRLVARRTTKKGGASHFTTKDRIVRCCGASIKGDELVLVTVVQDQGEFRIETGASLKQKLSGTANQQSVRAFLTAISGFIRNNKIDRISIRGRQAKGSFVSGPTTFKIEGLLQILENCAVEILPARTIQARVKKRELTLPANAHKYQTEAYQAACAALIG
jgi:hypothetical protein